MFFKILLGYLLGYIKIEVEGYFIERFMNICVSKNILLWNIKRVRSTFLIANISINDFRKIKKISKTTKCRIKIKEKKGLPFIFNRYRKRKIFGILLVSICVIVIGLSHFVWNIEVKCEEEINIEEIIAIVNENGLKIGVPINKIDTDKIINEIRIRRDDIAWAGVNFKGTGVIVEIVKAKEKPKIVSEDEACSIIADKDGVITKINAQNGTAVVEIGDVVKKGTTLVNRLDGRNIYRSKVCSRQSRN